MDTQKGRKAASGNPLSDIARAKTVVGAKQIRKALTAGRATRVFLAENADPAITEPLVALCQSSQVAYTWVRSMTELGHACGIDVGAAAAAAVN